MGQRFDQLALMKFAMTAVYNHPHLYSDFMNMSITDIGNVIAKLEGVEITRGTPFADFPVIIEKMQENHKQRMIELFNTGSEIDV